MNRELTAAEPRWRRAHGSATPPVAMLRAAALSVVVGPCLLAGCLDSSSTTSTSAYPTILTVRPTSFLGTLGCGGSGLHRYVVTLTDVSASDASPGAQVTSLPTSCALPTSFSLDTSVGHSFIGTIEGYDRDDIAPAAPGSREMRDARTGASVCPQWRATCGEPPGTTDPNPLRQPTIVIDLAETVVTGCSALVPVSPGDCATGSNADASASEVAAQDTGDAPSGDAGDSSANQSTFDAADARSPADATITTLDALRTSPDASIVDASLVDDSRTTTDATRDVGDGSPAQVLGDEFREGG